MKLQPDQLIGVNAIQSFQPGCITVNGVERRHSLVLPWQGEVRPWQVGAGPVVGGTEALAELSMEHFALLAAHEPELVIFGSGSRLRFAPPALLAPLMSRRIGIETMDTAAACRTYNILASEGRKVLAALLL
ncbi:MAG: hypothetical protein RLZZ584_4637 [Pseudomonadota bacterium]